MGIPLTGIAIRDRVVRDNERIDERKSNASVSLTYCTGNIFNRRCVQTVITVPRERKEDGAIDKIAACRRQRRRAAYRH